MYAKGRVKQFQNRMPCLHGQQALKLFDERSDPEKRSFSGLPDGMRRGCPTGCGGAARRNAAGLPDGMRRGC
ncbi:MAG: hypothetical protein NC091_12530, partial [Bacteroides sp.]|nr:hypothetical protein [Bacteroides sp.]